MDGNLSVIVTAQSKRRDPKHTAPTDRSVPAVWRYRPSKAVRAMSRRPPLPTGQRALPIDLKDTTFERLLAEIRESRKRHAAHAQRQLLKQSRVEFDNVPN
jgi:hypothetical protein